MWEVRTYHKDLTGERKQKTKRGFAKKSEALEWERNFKLKEAQSISMSFKSFVDIYLTDLEPRIKRNTFLTKKHIIETKILPYFGKRKLDDIRTSDVIQWQNEIMKLKKDNGELFSPTYLKTIHNQLSIIRRWGHKYETFGEDGLEKKNADLCNYSAEFKKKIVLEYLGGNITSQDLAAKYKIHAPSTVRTWIKQYNNHEDLTNSRKEGVYLMSKRVNKLDSDDTVTGSSNFGKFIKLFESDDSSWIEKISDSIE